MGSGQRQGQESPEDQPIRWSQNDRPINSQQPDCWQAMHSFVRQSLENRHFNRRNAIARGDTGKTDIFAQNGQTDRNLWLLWL